MLEPQFVLKLCSSAAVTVQHENVTVSDFFYSVTCLRDIAIGNNFRRHVAADSKMIDS